MHTAPQWVFLLPASCRGPDLIPKPSALLHTPCSQGPGYEHAYGAQTHCVWCNWADWARRRFAPYLPLLFFSSTNFYLKSGRFLKRWTGLYFFQFIRSWGGVCWSPLVSVGTGTVKMTMEVVIGVVQSISICLYIHWIYLPCVTMVVMPHNDLLWQNCCLLSLDKMY